ncbi:Hypothetical predicted protein [Cloeon dipterum]|uniref:Methyltransferase FkbM domain-containing protein n=1 Tax=Cloeon dipterum TaxID=197152 RepID=A0A8S1D451_9INSE|nr:Hypothetical predicted protein [Cloeon dipterum]
MSRTQDLYLAAAAAIALWWTISLQMSVRSFVQEVTTFKLFVYQSHTYMKEVLSSFENTSHLEDESRPHFSFSHTERKLVSEFSQEDENLIQYIKHNLLIPPPMYVGLDWGFDRSRGILPAVMNYLKNMKGGFHVECCAFEGHYSQAHFLETHHHWEGLVIEEEPSKLAQLIKMKRNVSILPTCVSPEKKPVQMMLNLRPDGSSKMSDNGTLLQCMPLFSVLKAAGKSTIDFFSFYNEGRELEILKTLPFDKVNIKAIAVYRAQKNKDVSETLKTFMYGKGFYNVNITLEDYVFLRNENL